MYNNDGGARRTEKVEKHYLAAADFLEILGRLAAAGMELAESAEVEAAPSPSPDFSEAIGVLHSSSS